MRLRTLVTVRVSQINSCAFCVDYNSWLLLKSGGKEIDVAQIANFASSDYFSTSEKSALQYAEAMTFSDRQVDKKIYSELAKSFDENEIIELTALIGQQNFSSKFNSALDIEAYGFCDIQNEKSD